MNRGEYFLFTLYVRSHLPRCQSAGLVPWSVGLRPHSSPAVVRSEGGSTGQGNFFLLREPTGCFRHKSPSFVDTNTAFLAAATPPRGLPAPMVGYRKVTASSVWPSDMPTGPHGTPRPTGPQAGRVTTQNTTDEHGRRWLVLCSQHIQKTRAAELLREAQGGLRSGQCATP